MHKMFNVIGELGSRLQGRMWDICKDIIRSTVLNFLEKKRRVHFIHTSDIMYPHKWGLTPIQLLIVSRYLDTLLWEKGEKPVWHVRLSVDDESVQMNKALYCEQYMHFLNMLEMNGFNPILSQFSAKQTPFWGVHDGTHRLGFLLKKCPNSFVPVKISHPLIRQPTNENGHEWLLSIGVRKEYVNQLEEEYNKLWHQMRKYIIAYFHHTEDFSIKKTKVINEFNKVGNVINIEDTILRRDANRKITVIKFTLPYQDLYFKNGRLKSRCIDILVRNITSIIGSGAWEIATSITESVLLEEKIVNTDANYRM